MVGHRLELFCLVEKLLCKTCWWDRSFLSLGLVLLSIRSRPASLNVKRKRDTVHLYPKRKSSDGLVVVPTRNATGMSKILPRDVRRHSPAPSCSWCSRLTSISVGVGVERGLLTMFLLSSKIPDIGSPGGKPAS